MYSDPVSSIDVADLALVADAKHPDLFECFVEKIKSNVPRSASGNDELALLALNPPAEKGVSLQGVERFDDRFNCGYLGLRRCLNQKIHQSSEILDRPFRIDYLRHDTGFGRLAFLPAALARNQATTSSCA